MDEKIISALRLIGLSKGEIAVYLDLNARGNAKAGVIAKRLNTHRANIYDSLQLLLEKGLVRKVIKDTRNTVFWAERPERLIDYIKENERHVREIIPSLESALMPSDHHESVILTKGDESVRAAILNQLRWRSPIITYSLPSSTSHFLDDDFLGQFHKKRTKEKISMRLLFNQKNKKMISVLNAIPFTEARYTDIKRDLPARVMICGDEVTTIIINKPTSVITMISKEIAQTYREQFEILWKHARS